MVRRRARFFKPEAVGVTYEKPDKETGWTAEETAQIVNWLLEKWGPAKPCPQCGVTAWSIGDFPCPLPAYAPNESIITSRRVYPCAAVICQNCGYMQFINLVIAGIDLDPKVARGTGNG
jgi:hypothetical protein